MSLLANLVSESIQDPTESVRSPSISFSSTPNVGNGRKGKGKVVPEKNKMIAAVTGATITSLTSKFTSYSTSIFLSTIGGSQFGCYSLSTAKVRSNQNSATLLRYTRSSEGGMLVRTSRDASIKKSYGIGSGSRHDLNRRLG
jgi:hypothetical protein